MNPAKFNLSKYSNDSLRDFLLEVDLEYCKELHELQNYYRLASNKLEIKKRNGVWLSLNNCWGLFAVSNVKKLVPNFFKRENYALDHKNLQLCLSLGFKIKKVHRALDLINQNS